MAHWYHPETGYLLDRVEYKDPKRKGQYREATLADARPLGYLPSVTTILQLLNRPGLTIWQMEQVAKAAWDLQENTMEQSYSEWSTSVIRQSKEYTEWTQSFGTATHWWLNKKLRTVETHEIPPMIPGSEECADGILAWLPANGYSFTHTEHRFARTDLGYAGTVDLIGTHWDVPCIVDLKTQEPPLTPYLEHALQLAGYDYALENVCTCTHGWRGEHKFVLLQPSLRSSFPCSVCDCKEFIDCHRERISLIANRLVPGEVKEHIWIDKDSTVEATNKRYDRIWLGLVDLWMGINNYDPRNNANTHPTD